MRVLATLSICAVALAGCGRTKAPGRDSIAVGSTASGHVFVGRDTATYSTAPIKFTVKPESTKAQVNNTVLEKYFPFSGTMKAGDCGSDNVSVVIRSDGSAHLASVSWTWSTHSGDYWWWGVDGLDAQQVKLWSVPFHKGPRMDDGNGGPPPRYHNDFDFTYDASKYNPTEYVRLWYKC